MKLGKGINYSRYCLWWEGTETLNFTDYMMPSTQNANRDKISTHKIAEASAHVSLIKQLGFNTIRLPVSFNVWTSMHLTDITQSPYWVVVDNMLSACKRNELKLVIDYHHAPLSDLNFENDKNRIKTLWLQIAERFKNSDVNDVIFEIFNEPNGSISTTNLVAFYQEIVTAIRNTGGNNAQRKIVVGGNEFYDIGFGDSGLLPFLQRNPFSHDPNIIYTVHFYHPTLFTWQGINDGDASMPTENVEFPATRDYSFTGEFFGQNYLNSQQPDILALNINGKGMGSVEWVKARMKQLKNLTDKGLTVWCGEIGVYRKFADTKSIENYLSLLLSSLKDANVDWCWWDFEAGMSFFNPVPTLQKGNPDLDKAFGFAAPFLNDKVDAQMRRLLDLDSRVKIQVLSITRNPTTKKDTFKIKIVSLDHLTSFKNFELNYQVLGKQGDINSRKTLKKTFLPKKSITTSLTGFDLLIAQLQVNYLDGHFRFVIPE